MLRCFLPVAIAIDLFADHGFVVLPWSFFAARHYPMFEPPVNWTKVKIRTTI